MSVADRVRRAGGQADRSEWMDYAVRAGLVCYGVMHLLVAWLALRLAFGHGSGNASSQGAFHQLAQTGPGRISLFVAGAGFSALVVWQGLEALWGHREEDGGKRVVKRLTSAGKAVVYACLAASAVTTATGGSSGGGGTDGITGRLMQVPAGQVLVAIVGVGILVVAGALVWRGWTGSFAAKLDADGRHGSEGRAYLALGRIGYVSKGVSIALVGALFLYAAATHDPKRSGGLDVALHKVLQQPYGAPLLVVIALGLACYGLFCFAWARHLSR